MQHLILLHGAIGSKEQLEPLATALKKNFIVHSIDFSGHGKRPVSNEKFSLSLFANDVLEYIHDNNIEQANIFGYSMGGYVAMHMAKYYPEKINRIITLATKFYWDDITTNKEVKKLNPDAISEKLPAFAEQLSKRHFPNNWKKVLEKTTNLLIEFGSDNPLKPEDYSTVITPCLILLGDRDKMVTLEETVAVYKKLPNAQLGILSNTPHPVEQVNLELLIFFIRQYLAVTSE